MISPLPGHCGGAAGGGRTPGSLQGCCLGWFVAAEERFFGRNPLFAARCEGIGLSSPSY